MTFTLLVPTLNEIDGMKQIMPKIDRSLFNQIIILDGGSIDGTVEYAREFGYEVYVQKRKGLRHAYCEVWPLIRSNYVITFSPDGNSLVEKLKPLIDKTREGNYDMVIVSRYAGDATSDDDDVITAFGNWLFTKTINFLHGGNYTDAMVIYRSYRTDLIKKLSLDDDQAYAQAESLFSTTISWEPLLSVRAAKQKLKLAEIPGSEPDRIGGERKLQVLRWGAAYYFQFLREAWYR